MIGKYVVFIAAIMLTACATNKEWSATGGSRSDGIVAMAYTHGNMEIPSADEGQALLMAQTRCKAWGYSGAEAFGGESKRCISPAYAGCHNWEVVRQFQCLGQPDK